MKLKRGLPEGLLWIGFNFSRLFDSLVSSQQAIHVQSTLDLGYRSRIAGPANTEVMLNVFLKNEGRWAQAKQRSCEAQSAHLLGLFSVDPVKL